MIPIEKGIPRPPSPQRGGQQIYPWRDMEIGDSFFSNRVPFKNIQTACSRMGKVLGWKFRGTSRERRTPGVEDRISVSDPRAATDRCRLFSGGADPAVEDFGHLPSGGLGSSRRLDHRGRH